MSLTKQQVISLAYFDGTSVEKIGALDLSAEDLRKIAGQCGQWAYEAVAPSARSAYLKRAEEIADLAEQRQFDSSRFVQDVHWHE